jgi:hypothetical protein
MGAPYKQACQYSKRCNDADGSFLFEVVHGRGFSGLAVLNIRNQDATFSNAHIA